VHFRLPRSTLSCAGYISIYIYIYVYIYTHTYIYIYIHICRYIYTYIYVCVYIYMHTTLKGQVNALSSASIGTSWCVMHSDIYIYICICIYIYVYIYIYVCIYIFIYMCMYIYTYVYTTRKGPVNALSSSSIGTWWCVMLHIERCPGRWNLSSNHRGLCPGWGKVLTSQLDSRVV